MESRMTDETPTMPASEFPRYVRAGEAAIVAVCERMVYPIPAHDDEPANIPVIMAAFIVLREVCRDRGLDADALWLHAIRMESTP
jgi:hypothetical protein